MKKRKGDALLNPQLPINAGMDNKTTDKQHKQAHSSEKIPCLLLHYANTQSGLAECSTVRPCNVVNRWQSLDITLKNFDIDVFKSMCKKTKSVTILISHFQCDTFTKNPMRPKIKTISLNCQIVLKLVEHVAWVKERNLQSYLAKEFLFLRALFHNYTLYASQPDREKHSTKKLEF